MPNKLVESKMTQLIELLGDMVEKGGVDELDSEPATDFAKECWERFCKIYDDPDFRHSYYTISSSLEKYDPDQRDSLPVYLDRVVDYARMKEDPNSCRILKSVQKLLDHVELECLRINRMDQVKRDADRAERMQSEAIKLNQATEEASRKLDERVSGFHEQSITILGIFSAVVIGFMSGVSMFTSGFNNLNQVNVYIITFYSVFVGILVFDLLFMLVFFIAKISGHSIAREVPKSKNWLFSTFYRYPGVYCFHIFAIIALALLIFLQAKFGASVQPEQIAEAVASSALS